MSTRIEITLKELVAHHIVFPNPDSVWEPHSLCDREWSLREDVVHRAL